MNSGSTEELYSARGSQSAIVSEWVRRNLGLDSEDTDSRFLLETFSNKWGNKFFEVRPQSAVSMFGGFHVKDAMLQVAHDVLVSIPLYCKIAGMSMNEIEYENYYVKLKPEYSDGEFARYFAAQFNIMIAEYGAVAPAENARYANWYRAQSFKSHHEEGHRERTQNMTRIFGFVTLVAMGLCFFSLSSNMSSNIFDQSREISIMLSLGFTKTMLVKLFVYEALILVISSSLSGFVIGLFIGNLMMLQQAIL